MAITPEATANPTDGFLAATQMHDVEITIAPTEIEALIASYLSDGSKDWGRADITINGTLIEGAGLRLKGNSSLRGITANSAPEGLPWKVRLDKYTDGTNYGGMTTFIVRSNSMQSALNEALALDLLAEAGLPASRAAYLSLRVNGSAPTLRLSVESLDDQWVAANFNTSGVLYKADAQGDYSYRGTEASAYDDVFDVAAGAKDLTPLTTFLQFINESSDVDFAAGISSHLDTDAFARYLGLEALIANSDDIDGRGNNSYLWWDERSTQMSVVAWDHNAAFKARPQDRGGAPTDLNPTSDGAQNQQSAGDMPPERGQPGPSDNMTPRGGAAPGGVAQQNVLVTRFNTLAGGAAATKAAKAALTSELLDSGKASAALAAWVELLTGQANELLDSVVVQNEADEIRAYLT